MEPEIKMSEPTTLEKAQEVLRQLEEKTAILQAKIEVADRLAASNLLSGKSSAGKSEAVEETPQDYAKRIMRGGA